MSLKVVLGMGLEVEKSGLNYYSFGLNWDTGLPEGEGVENKYQYNGKERIKGLEWQDFGFRYYDPTIGRFTGVDPIAEDFAFVSTFNYAENEPIANIDLWGLQAFRANVSGSIKAGETGFEVKFLGSKTGVTLKHGSNEMLGFNASYDSDSGGDVTGTYFDSSEETYGMSGGNVLGGELSHTTDTKTGEGTTTTVVSLGLFYIKNEKNDGEDQSQTYLGLEVGVGGGAMISGDVSLSAEISLDYFTPEEAAPVEPSNVAQRDNTNVVVPLLLPEELK